MVYPDRGQVVRGWTTGEAARRTGLSKSTILRMIDDGELLATRGRGTWWRIDPEDGELLVRESDPRLSVAEREAATSARRALHRRRGHAL